MNASAPKKVGLTNARKSRLTFWRWHAALAAASLAFIYVLLVTGVFLISKYYFGAQQTSYLDLLLPTRWAHHRVVQGDRHIAIAEQQLREQKFSEAIQSLRAGVAKSPENIRGRVLLAQLQSAANRPDLAQQTLLAGLPFLAKDPAYLQALFGFLLQQQLDDFTLKTARELLAHEPAPRSERAQLIALAAASAAYFRGNYDLAEDYLNSHHLAQSLDGRLLQSQIEWERGYRELALLHLTALSREFPRSESASAQLGAWLRELGRHDEFRRLALTRQIAEPRLPSPRIDLLYALRHDGETARIDREVAAILREFPRDQATLVALADFAANTGDAALARRIYQHCRSLRLPWESPAFLTVEALVVQRDFRGALDLTRALLNEHPDWAKRYSSLFNSLQSVAYFGLGDTASADLYLANFLGQPYLRANNLLAVSKRFLDVGARDQARQVLAQAVVADPLNQAALTALIQLDLELHHLAPLPDNLRRLVAMRKPSADLLRAAGHQLGSDLFLFTPAREDTLRLLERALAAATPLPRTQG